jgi:RimJ/RimL family protein N-acetyltransferase
VPALSVAPREWRRADAPALAPMCGGPDWARFGDDGLSAALGYWLVPAARGSGLATAAVRLPCRRGFEELSLERIELLVEPGNAPSRRVAERLGAVPDGERPHSDHPDGPALLTFELTRASMSP